jgi:nicotinate-nucleotide adenylyltransferase
MDRIGVFGGTFDPPHWGHLKLAEAALRQLQLDVVLWVPAGQPPHKRRRARSESGARSNSNDSLTPAHHRVEMIRRIIADHPHFLLSRLDVDRPGPHYTADLCALLADYYGTQTTLWFLVGEDSLRELPAWHTPDQVLQRCRLGVFPRKGPPVDWDELCRIIPEIRDRVDWLEGQIIEISATAIRSRARRGEPIRDLVPPPVCHYIRNHQLYRPAAED